MVICAQEKMERVGWDKTRDTVLVSEDLATGGIRAHLVMAKGNGDPWIAGKIKDDIEEFGYGVAPVRLKSDQEPAIVDVQRAVIAKRCSAPAIAVNSPVGDSQSNGRVENATKKDRNMVKTILSRLESRWGFRVTRDHPVHPWMFEWAAQYTSHVTFFSCLCACVIICHTTLAQVFVRVISSMSHALACLISLRLSSHSSFVPPIFNFILLIFHFLFNVDVAGARSPVHFAE